MKQKKALAPVIVVTLLLFISVVSILSLQGFLSTFLSDLESKISSNNNHNVLTIEGISSNLDSTLIYIKNSGNSFEVINSIKLNDMQCNLIGSDLVPKNKLIEVYVDCLTVNESSIKIFIESNSGVLELTPTRY